MTMQKIAEFKIVSTYGSQIICDVLDEPEFFDALDGLNLTDRESQQGFVWMPGLIIVFPQSDIGSYWVEVYQAGASDSLDLERSYFAIALPFYLENTAHVHFSGTDDMRAGDQALISAGQYRLVFQECFMTQDEVDVLPVPMPSVDLIEEPENLSAVLGPKRCIFTFIPVDQPCEAEILQRLSKSRILKPLTLRT
jgi:hypothetical protein